MVAERGSRYLPEAEKLTFRRMEFARAKGLTNEEAREQWESMKDFEFRRPYHDWDRVWMRWCRQYKRWDEQHKRHEQEKGRVTALPQPKETKVSAVVATRLKLAEIFKPIPEGDPDDAA